MNVQDRSGQTPLHRACEKAQWEVAKLLLRNGSDARYVQVSEVVVSPFVNSPECCCVCACFEQADYS